MREVRRVVGIPVALFIAVVAQVSIVNRAPLPGGAWPDVVLLTVTAIGAMLGPMTGMVAGFCAGLALDVAPPAGHLAGEYALVFCLAGYLCGRMRDIADPVEEHTTITTVTVMVIGAAGGEAARAALGLMLSDPDMTGPAIGRVLPGALLYDLLLAPFILWLTALAIARPARPNAPDPHRTAQRPAEPRLRLSGGPSAVAKARQPPTHREPRLRLAGSTSPALSRTNSLSRTNRGVWSSSGFLGRRPVSLNFAGGGGALGGGALGPSLFSGKKSLAGAGPGKGWLRAEKPVSAPDWRRNSPGKGWVRPSKPAKAPHVSSPGRGWLRQTKPPKTPRRHSPGRGWLKTGGPAPGGLRAKSPGRGWLKGSGVLGKPTTYQSRSVYQSRSAFRRRRGLRMGGRR